MDLPSTRELELETLIRQRDTQMIELKDEVNRLRRYIPTRPEPSMTEPVTLPPALISLLLPTINQATNETPTSSGSVTAALTQRLRVLQEENDELYDILKLGETGKLKDETRGLRKVVTKLEGALRESHKVISSLSNELDKAYEVIRQNSTPKSQHLSRHSHHHSSNSASGANPPSKLPPTGPRAHKRARMSPHISPHISPARSTTSLPTHKQHESLDRGGRSSQMNMEVDEVQGREESTNPAPRERHHRDRGGRERDRDRDREGNRSKRNVRGGSKWTERSGSSTDRTLAERMGL